MLGDLIEDVISVSVAATNTLWESRGVALQKFASLMNTVYSVDNSVLDVANEMDLYRKHSRHFKVGAVSVSLMWVH